MIKDKARLVCVAVAVAFAVLLASVQGISIANAATPPISRSLPVDVNLYSMSCDGGVPNGQLGGFVTASGVPTGVQTRIGSGTTDINSTYCAFGMAYNPVTNTAYWANPTGSGDATKQQLFSIDISTGVSTYIAEIRADQSGRAWAVTGGTNLTVMYGITFRAGKMFAMWRGQGTPVWVGEVEVNAANVADNGKIYSAIQLNDIDPLFNVASISNEWPWNFAYNSVDEKFYTAGYLPRSGRTGRTLYEINVATGLTTDKGQSGNTNALFWGMQFDSNGVIWGGDDRLNSATVTGWTTAGDLQQTATFSTFSPLTRHGINGVFIAPSFTAPAAPTLNTVTGGDRSISVAFTAGANGGATITDYEYSLNGGTYISAATTTSPFTITSGISGRTSYSVTLKARNSVGLSSASGSLSATTTDSSADASEAAAAAAEAARVAAVEAARVAAVNAAIAAAAAKRAAEQKEMSELLAVLPSIAGLALSIGDLTNSLLVKQKCVNGKKTKTVSYGSKCPKGFVKRK